MRLQARLATRKPRKKARPQARGLSLADCPPRQGVTVRKRQSLMYPDLNLPQGTLAMRGRRKKARPETFGAGDFIDNKLGLEFAANSHTKCPWLSEEGGECLRRK